MITTFKENDSIILKWKNLKTAASSLINIHVSSKDKVIKPNFYVMKELEH